MTDEANLPRLAIFARVPELGRVKQRLAADVGDEVALQVYRSLLAQTLTRLQPGTGMFAPEVWLDREPPGELAQNRLGQLVTPLAGLGRGSASRGASQLEACVVEREGGAFGRVRTCAAELSAEAVNHEQPFAGLSVRLQRTGDLGSRMRAAFDDGVTVLVGTDIPDLDASYVDAALAALTQTDVVFGPVDDGGYCLVGMRRLHGALFEGIPWSTARVLDASLRVAERLRLSVHLLDPLWDLDDLTDMRRWQAFEA